ncbi:MAG: Ig-like domain-containing protein [Actinomycetota bacterium]|nr:Ig-like domain-containing protein [Actinomycetota bacterium]
MGPQSTLYVANPYIGSVNEYASGASGNATPIRNLSGGATGFLGPDAVITATVRVATTTALASSANPSIVGQSVTYTATVTPRAAAGTVAFTGNGGAITGCDAVMVSGGTANCTMTYRSGGSHSINVTFNGGLDFEPSNSNVLSQSVTEVLPSPPATGRQ